MVTVGFKVTALCPLIPSVQHHNLFLSVKRSILSNEVQGSRKPFLEIGRTEIDGDSTIFASPRSIVPFQHKSGPSFLVLVEGIKKKVLNCEVVHRFEHFGDSVVKNWNVA